MDVIPLTKLIVSIILFGFCFYFFTLAANFVIHELNLGSGGVYIGAAIWLFGMLPAVAFFGSSLRFLMVMQKKSRGY